MTDERATVWVCCACGKRSNDEYGRNPIDGDWDESCMFNARRCYVDSLVVSNGRVVEIKDGGIVPGQSTESAKEAVERLGREMADGIEKLRTGDLSDLDPELLELARNALERLGEKATSVSVSASEPVRQDDTERP